MASKSGHTPIHAAAESGNIGQIPRDRLTVDLLISRNDSVTPRCTPPPSRATSTRSPASSSNRATLLIRNYNGGTPIGAAIRHGHADQLPAEFVPAPPTAIQKFLYRIGASRPPHA